MNQTNYCEPIEDDFTECLSEWIDLLYALKVRRVSFRRFKPDNREIGTGGFLTIYQHAIFTGAGNCGRDIADLQVTFLGVVETRIWLGQILFWHHVLTSNCTSLSLDIHRGDLVSSLVYTDTQGEYGQRDPLTAKDAVSWFIQRL